MRGSDPAAPLPTELTTPRKHLNPTLQAPGEAVLSVWVMDRAAVYSDLCVGGLSTI